MNILPKTCLELSKIENIVAIKEASGNISQVAEIASLCGNDLNIYSGNDDQILPILSLGGIGVISVLSNILPNSTHELVENFFNDNIEMNAEAKEFMESDQVIERVISYFKAELEKLDDWNVDVINTAINNVKNALNVKGKLLYMPIRIKASGLMHGPDLADTIYLIGKDTVIKRLK